jgi:predicted DNA-binding protein with PD1-like motif
VLEPGDEVLASIAAVCREHQFPAAVVPVFLGAFTCVTLIGTREPVADEDAPLPLSETVEWVEGLGAGTVAPDAAGTPTVHLHAAVGRKSAGTTAYAGHVLSAVTHYTAEILIEEVPGPPLWRSPDPAAHGIPTLRLGAAGVTCGAPGQAGRR